MLIGMNANKGPVRRRRSPEQSRTAILAAAGDLIARDGPDRVTLTRVAEAAGVSHGLVSHYFGTYRALAAEVLRAENRQHQEQVQERIRTDQGVPYASRVLDVLFDTVADQRYLRLWAWSALHPDHDAMVTGGLAVLVDAMEAGIATAVPSDRVPSRDRVEAVVLLGLAAAYGYALGGSGWQAELGHGAHDRVRDLAFRSALAGALADYLEGDS